MPLASWPTALVNVKPEKDGFTFNTGTNKVEASFEGGQSFSKKTFRKIPDRFSCQFLVTSAELNALLTFFKTTLDEGTLNFTWSHPRTDAQIEVKFVGEAPRYSPSEGDYWSVQAGFEIVNEL